MTVRSQVAPKTKFIGRLTNPQRYAGKICYYNYIHFKKSAVGIEFYFNKSSIELNITLQMFLY